MKHFAKAILLTACSGMLLAGCGAHTDHAEQGTAPNPAATARPAVTAADDHNKLYESDDVHRETDVTEPDVLDRAETAVSKAGDKAMKIMTDARDALSDAAADMTDTDRTESA